MVQLAFVFVAVAAALVSVQASPLLEKRIAQIIADSMTKWEQACDAATSNSLQCNPLSVAAFQTLLAAAGPCDQQNAADNLIDFSKQQQNNAEMIALAQVFCQQPRNTPNSVYVPYCQQAPRNSELKGLYQCQYEGANPKVFVNGTPVGGAGTIPFGMNSPLNPPGSCLAHPSGPIADGTQLSDITTNPFGSGGGGSVTAVDQSSDDCPAAPATQTPTPTMTLSTASASKPTDDLAVSPPPPMSTTSGFQLSNGNAAQKLNAQFDSLTPDSPCTVGEDACVNAEFAECVNGKFVLQPCSPSLKCYALPLILKPGTTIACTTDSDAEQRIANTGATGGITGSGS